VGFSEILPAASRCYAANFPTSPSLGDAEKVSQWPKCDVLTAGFPCQPFSSACNANIRNAHAKRDFFQVVLRAIRDTGASRIVLENVPTLLTMGRPQWERMCTALRDECGFSLSHQILDARAFGLPQARKRLYLVGRRDGTTPVFPHVACGRVSTLSSILQHDAVCDAPCDDGAEHVLRHERHSTV